MIGTVMITLATILATAAIGGIVTGVWHYFSAFIQETMKSITKKLKKLPNVTFAGIKCFLKKTWGTIKEIIRAYKFYKDRNEWEIETIIRKVPKNKVEEEIPADIRAKVEREHGLEHDVTENVELKLKRCA